MTLKNGKPPRATWRCGRDLIFDGWTVGVAWGLYPDWDEPENRLRAVYKHALAVRWTWRWTNPLRLSFICR